jgi:D-inositol-3-phosphate glycosyltransferase
MLRLLAVSNMYPTQEAPESGSFVEQQIKGLKQIGLNVDLMLVDRNKKGMRVYLGLGRKVRERVTEFHADLVHVMYGGVIADEVTRNVGDRPTIVSFCGSDLLGENLSGAFRRLISGYGVMASRRSAKQASGIVVKSNNLRDALPCDVDLSKVRVIPNGIDLQLFKPLDRNACRTRLGWRRDCFHVVFAAIGADPC